MERNNLPDSEISLAFEDFWGAYPRKIAKGHARKAFLAAIKKERIVKIISAADQFATKCRTIDPKYVPHPATWLNGERWLDEEAKYEPSHVPLGVGG